MSVLHAVFGICARQGWGGFSKKLPSPKVLFPFLLQPSSWSQAPSLSYPMILFPAQLQERMHREPLGSCHMEVQGSGSHILCEGSGILSSLSLIDSPSLALVHRWQP